MMLHPRVTRSVVELVKRFEGLRRQAAQLPDGGWTIGYGHTLSAREGAAVSPEDAEALLYYDLSEVAQKVEAWTFTPLNQNQFEALTALAFNIGIENLRHSTVLKRVNEGQHLQAASAFELWRKSNIGGEALVVDALVRRRAAEKAHYLTPPEGFRPSPTPVLKPSFDHSVVQAAVDPRDGNAQSIMSTPRDTEIVTATSDRPIKHAEWGVEPGRYHEQPLPAAAVEAFGAAGAATLATARLHQLFPEKSEDLDAPAPPPFGFQSEAPPSAEPAFKVVRETPFGYIPDAPAEAEAPPMPKPLIAEAAQVAGGLGGFTSSPVRQFETESPLGNFAETEAVVVTPPVSAEIAPNADAYSALEMAADAKPHSASNRTFIYAATGGLGAILFTSALFSMFLAKASPANLVIGLIGILLMTPAGGYFLLNFLNRKDAASQI